MERHFQTRDPSTNVAILRLTVTLGNGRSIWGFLLYPSYGDLMLLQGTSLALLIQCLLSLILLIIIRPPIQTIQGVRMFPLTYHRKR